MFLKKNKFLFFDKLFKKKNIDLLTNYESIRNHLKFVYTLESKKKKKLLKKMKRIKSNKKLIIWLLAFCFVFLILFINSFEIEANADYEYGSNEFAPNMFNFKRKKCKIIYIKKCTKTNVNQTYFLLNLLKNKEFIAKCDLKVISLVRLNEAVCPVIDDEISLAFDSKKGLNRILNKEINANQFTSLLVSHNLELTESDWDLVEIMERLSKYVQVYYLLGFSIDYQISLQKIGFMRRIEKISKNLIVVDSFQYYTLLHSFGVNKNKIAVNYFKLNKFAQIFININENNISTSFSDENQSLIDTTEHIYFNRTNIFKYIRNNLNQMFCLYADFNVQLNVKMDLFFTILSIGIVNENVYTLADMLKGFDTFKLNEQVNSNFLSIDYKKQTLKFESINVGFIIEKYGYELTIRFFKFNKYAYALGIFGCMFRSKSEYGKNYAEWKIKDGDIFSHDSQKQSLTVDNSNTNTINIYNVKTKTNTLINFQIEGTVFNMNSFGVVNRKLFLSLYKIESLNVLIDPEENLDEQEKDFEIILVHSFYKRQQIKQSNKKTIVLQNTGNMNSFRRKGLPNQTYFIHQKPWEFHSVPIQWIDYFNKIPNEIWVPSEYNRQAFIANGINPNKVQVVPHGIFFDKCNSSTALTKFNFKTKKSFKFLTIGGMLPRKGTDLIIESYFSSFTKNDDVTLIIHSIYGDFALERLKEIMLSPNSPEIILLRKNQVADREIVDLLKQANVYLSPYRSEGFGLTILEAMATGLVPIVTKYGPSKEFCSDRCCYFVEAFERDCLIDPCGNKTIFGHKTIYQPKWSEPSLKSLSALMLNTYKRPQDLKERSIACKNEASMHTWDEVTKKIQKRIKSIARSLEFNIND